MFLLVDRQTDEYCETELFEASCGQGHVILITRSLYGRMKVGRCIDRDYGYVGCSTDVLHLTDRACSGRRNCVVPVPNSEFRRVARETCPRDLKPYLEASYTCVRGNRE